jgi:hypothetical protein
MILWRLRTFYFYSSFVYHWTYICVEIDLKTNTFRILFDMSDVSVDIGLTCKQIWNSMTLSTSSTNYSTVYGLEKNADGRRFPTSCIFMRVYRIKCSLQWSEQAC